jgi:ubiquinone/menaquinone biosynthesis C-methylase UbiE
MTETSKVAQHYERTSAIERLKAALKADGLDTKPLSSSDLAPLDQFHSRGLAATMELAAALRLDSATSVLDIGSGLGGPSRYLAATYGCSVQGVDLSYSFVEVADFLAEKSNLTDKVSYQQGDALQLPFVDETFDVAWTQHVAMNIADRAAFYREAFRVLRPGGRFAMFDVVAASDAALHYPVPWASHPELSFLVTAERMRALLVEQGFQVTSWSDTTAAGVAWFEQRKQAQAQQTAAPALGLHIVMGADFGITTANLARNLREGRAALIQAIVEKP